jgi:hypothetical protein
MTHAQNLAAYCRRRAEVARAAGDLEKAARLEATAAQWDRQS